MTKPPEVLEAMHRIAGKPLVCEACGATPQLKDGVALIGGLWVCVTCEDGLTASQKIREHPMSLEDWAAIYQTAKEP